MCKKIISFFIALTLIYSANISSSSASSVSDSAKASILMIQGSNEVIYSKNPDKKLSMASTTKIMTAVLVIENGNLDEEITVTDKMVRVEGTSSGLLAGDKIDLKTLLYCMMLQSGNDAANVAAFAISGSIEKFADLMNKKAQEIGMENTHFATASGLDSDDHYSTAYDMALLTSYALNLPLFVEICSAYTKTVSYGNPKYNRTITNHNKLLKSYEGMIGVKTGYTKKSGRCLVTAAQRNGLTLICVTLDDWSDWDDHKNLLDYGFKTAKKVELKLELKIKTDVVGSKKHSVDVKMQYEPDFFSAKKNFEYSSKIEIQHFLYAPVKKGNAVGKVTFYDKSGNEISSVPLVSSDNADLFVKTDNADNTNKGDNSSCLKRILNFFKGEKNVG